MACSTCCPKPPPTEKCFERVQGGVVRAIAWSLPNGWADSGCDYPVSDAENESLWEAQAQACNVRISPAFSGYVSESNSEDVSANQSCVASDTKNNSFSVQIRCLDYNSICFWREMRDFAYRQRVAFVHSGGKITDFLRYRLSFSRTLPETAKEAGVIEATFRLFGEGLDFGDAPAFLLPLLLEYQNQDCDPVCEEIVEEEEEGGDG